MFLSIVPPLATIFLVFLTRNVIKSLFCGVLIAAFVVANFSPLQSIVLAAKKIFTVLELGNLTGIQGLLSCEKLLLFIFLLMLGVILSLIAESGEGFGYAERLCSRLKTKTEVQLASIFLSMTLFIDDYLNSLTTSSVMRNLTDKFGIPRIKLAFLTTAMAAPLCSLVPITSWAAAIIMFLFEAGIKPDLKTAIILADPFITFSKSIPFIFFSIFLILTAFFIVIFNLSYGIIEEHEKIAVRDATNLLGNSNKKIQFAAYRDCNAGAATHSSFNFFSPLFVISGGIFLVMLATGGYFTSGLSLIAALTLAKAELSLFLGGALGLVYTLGLFLLQRKIDLRGMLNSFKEGFFMMKDSLIVLALAWTLANFMTKDLETGKYLAQVLMPFLSQMFLPLSVFLIAGLISFSIGSAWATMAVIFPMVIPMVAEFSGKTVPVTINFVGLVYPVIGAVISGAIFGSSLSPIADLLVITSKNTEVDHFEYVKAQIQYLLPVGIGSALAFGLAGLLFNYFNYLPTLLISGSAGIFLIFGITLSMSFYSKI